MRQKEYPTPKTSFFTDTRVVDNESKTVLIGHHRYSNKVSGRPRGATRCLSRAQTLEIQEEYRSGYDDVHLTRSAKRNIRKKRASSATKRYSYIGYNY